MNEENIKNIIKNIQDIIIFSEEENIEKIKDMLNIIEVDIVSLLRTSKDKIKKEYVLHVYDLLKENIRGEFPHFAYIRKVSNQLIDAIHRLNI